MADKFDCWVVHGSGDWSREHLEEDAKLIEQKLLKTFMEVLLGTHRNKIFIMIVLTIVCNIDSTRSERIRSGLLLGSPLEIRRAATSVERELLVRRDEESRRVRRLVRRAARRRYAANDMI